MRLQDNPYIPTDWKEAHRQLDRLYRDTAQQVNQMSEGQSQAVTNAVAAMPTSGTYTAGDFVQNSAPAIAGAPGTRYVIRGWLRITNGTAHVAGTDWVEFRGLTGT